jgi:hypothetical protein
MADTAPPLRPTRPLLFRGPDHKLWAISSVARYPNSLEHDEHKIKEAIGNAILPQDPVSFEDAEGILDQLLVTPNPIGAEIYPTEVGFKLSQAIDHAKSEVITTCAVGFWYHTP